MGFLDGRALLHPQEKTLEIGVAVGRLGQHDRKGPELASQRRDPALMLALAAFEEPEQRHVRHEHRSPELTRQLTDSVGQHVVGGPGGLEPEMIGRLGRAHRRPPASPRVYKATARARSAGVPISMYVSSGNASPW